MNWSETRCIENCFQSGFGMFRVLSLVVVVIVVVDFLYIWISQGENWGGSLPANYGGHILLRHVAPLLFHAVGCQTAPTTKN